MVLFKRGLANILQKNASDVVFVSALRTPVTRAKKGGFKDTFPEEMLAHVCSPSLPGFSVGLH
jgi:acetyl-CoA acyltransferase 1